MEPAHSRCVTIINFIIIIGLALSFRLVEYQLSAKSSHLSGSPLLAKHHSYSTLVALCRNLAGSETDIIITHFKRKLRSREAKWSHPNCREGEQWHNVSNLKQFSTLQRVLAGVLSAPWTWKWLKAPARWNPASSPQVPIPAPPQVKPPAPNRGMILPSPPPPPLHVHVDTHTHNCTLFLSLTLSAPLLPKMPLPLSWSFSTKIRKYHLIKQSAWPSTPSTLLNRT